MSPANVQNIVVKYLDEAQLMQIVTNLGTQPWVATVFFATDNQHYLYWLSPPSTRHSHEIERNNRVVGAITQPHQFGMPQQGLQFEGIAREVPNDELELSFQAYAERFDAHHRLQGILNGEDENRLYCIVPTTFILWDEANFPTQPKQEWRLGAAQDFGPAAPAAPRPDAPYNPMME